jgi:hypothetical protein
VGNVHAAATVAADKPRGCVSAAGRSSGERARSVRRGRVHGRAESIGPISIAAASYTPKDTWVVVRTATAPA